MVKVVREDGDDLEVYARMHPYPHAENLSYVDFFYGSEAQGHLVGRLGPMWTDVAETIVRSLPYKRRAGNAASKRQ